MARLFAEEKRQRVLAAAERWPQLPAASIAVIASASPGYVSEVLKSSNQSGCRSGLDTSEIDRSRKADRVELPFCKSV